MNPPLDPEFLHLVQAVEVLESVAIEHEKKEDDGFCYGNRTFIAAMVMSRLGLDVADIGEVCRHLIEMEDDGEPESPDGDEILDAKEIA